MSRRLSSGAMKGSVVPTPLFSNGARDLFLTMVAGEVEVAVGTHRQQGDRDADLTLAQ
jgi:hypothetical protein